MNTTRNIRIATGIKRIELGNENFAMLQIGDILKQHREVLINSLVSDLRTYIGYMFGTPATKEQLDRIKDKLSDLKNSTISVSAYGEIMHEVLTNESTYVKAEPFYHEINTVIADELNPSQLLLVN